MLIAPLPRMRRLLALALAIPCFACSSDAGPSSAPEAGSGAVANVGGTGGFGDSGGNSGAGATGGEGCDCGYAEECMGSTIYVRTQNAFCGCDVSETRCAEGCIDTGRNLLCGLSCGGKTCPAPTPATFAPELCCTDNDVCGVVAEDGACIPMYPPGPPDYQCPKTPAYSGCCAKGVCGALEPAPGAGCVPLEELGVPEPIFCGADAG